MGMQSIPPTLMAAFVLAFGSFACYLYVRRGRREDLTFSLTCLGIVAYDIGAAGVYAARSVAEGAQWQRVQLVSMAFGSVALIHFVSACTGQVGRMSRAFFTIWGLVSGTLGAFERVGLMWRPNEPLIKPIRLPGNITITYFEAATGPLGKVQAVMALLELVVVFVASLRVYGRDTRTRALSVSLGVFCAALLNDMFVTLGWYRFVYVLEYGFSAMALVLVLPITGELVEAGVVIAEREALEEQLRVAARMEAVGRLAGGVAHDLNNQLTPIIGYSELALKTRRLGPQLWTYFEQISDAANHARELTQQLLAFARRQVLNICVLDLNELIAEAQKTLKRVIPEHITLEVRLDSRACRVRADATQLRQIVFNLALNARDAMPTGGTLEISTGRRQGSLAPNKPNQKGFIVLTVRDSGIGMDETTQARVFEPFFTTKSNPSNSGLGLPTVYGIVRQHGGQVSVQSAPGEGATFEVWLPEVFDSVPARQQSTPPNSNAPRRGTVLVVEDETSVRQLVCSVLAESGFSVLDAESPIAARQLVERGQRRIDLLLTDVVMPEMSGPELYDRLRERLPGLPVLFMSGYSVQLLDENRRSQLNGALLTKPFSSSELVSAVEAALASVNAKREANRGQRRDPPAGVAPASTS